jgi:hypothetical protein
MQIATFDGDATVSSAATLRARFLTSVASFALQ